MLGGVGGPGPVSGRRRHSRRHCLTPVCPTRPHQCRRRCAVPGSALGIAHLNCTSARRRPELHPRNRCLLGVANLLLEGVATHSTFAAPFCALFRNTVEHDRYNSAQNHCQHRAVLDAIRDKFPAPGRASQPVTGAATRRECSPVENPNPAPPGPSAIQRPRQRGDAGDGPGRAAQEKGSHQNSPSAAVGPNESSSTQGLVVATCATGTRSPST